MTDMYTLAELEKQAADAVKGSFYPPVGPETFAALVSDLLAARKCLTALTYRTERVEKPCGGTHSQYSSMANDRICPHCNEWEDGPAGKIAKTVFTADAQMVRSTLGAMKVKP